MDRALVGLQDAAAADPSPTKRSPRRPALDTAEPVYPFSTELRDAAALEFAPAAETGGGRLAPPPTECRSSRRRRRGAAGAHNARCRGRSETVQSGAN